MFTSHDHRGLLEGQSLRKPTSSVRKGRDRGLKACRRSNTQAVKLDAQLSSRGEVRFHLLCVFTSSAPPSGERPHHPTARHGRVFTSANRLQSSCTRASAMHSSALASTHTSTPAPREELLFSFSTCVTFRHFDVSDTNDKTCSSEGCKHARGAQNLSATIFITHAKTTLH